MNYVLYIYIRTVVNNFQYDLSIKFYRVGTEFYAHFSDSSIAKYLFSLQYTGKIGIRILPFGRYRLVRVMRSLTNIPQIEKNLRLYVV